MSPIPIQALSLDRSDRDTLHLLVQSPAVLFAYWQLSARKSAMVQEHFGVNWQELQPTLRIYDITGLSFDGSEANEVSELPLPDGDSCFLSGFRPGTSYIADLGIVNELGHFLPLLRSNAVEIPRTENLANAHANTFFSPAMNADPSFTPSTYPITFTVIKPIQYEQFSAYSVYPPKASDAVPGGEPK